MINIVERGIAFAFSQIFTWSRSGKFPVNFGCKGEIRGIIMQTLEPTTRGVMNSKQENAVQAQPPVNRDEVIISMRNVSKQFGKNEPTVRDLNFEVQRGQIFCLLGASGSGKSTTMRMLTGVYKPSSGDVSVLGAVPSKFKKRTRERIGYMPQQFVLFPELTTLENINFLASVYGMSYFGRRVKVRQALEFVDLWEARNHLASNLSGGMQRRLELATTLVHHPDLIFVDEPTAGIDPILRAKFWEHFKSLSAEGRTLFVTTQYVTEADYCDIVAILSRGRLLSIGTPEAIRREAMGGEIIDLTLPELTSQAIRLLRSLPGMRRIRTISAEELRLTVDDATESLKEILALFEQHNIEIQSIQPYRPDFEEVFVQLMEQDAAANPEPEDEAKHKDKDKNKNKDKITEPSPKQEVRPSLEQSLRQDPLPQPQPVVNLIETKKRVELVQTVAPNYRPNAPVQDELVQPAPMQRAYPLPPVTSVEPVYAAENVEQTTPIVPAGVANNTAPSLPFEAGQATPPDTKKQITKRLVSRPTDTTIEKPSVQD